MRLLLDTHIWIWMLMEPGRLSSKIVKILQDPDTERWISPISVWEVILLAKKGRLALNVSVEEWIGRAVNIASVKEAQLNTEVALATSSLRLPHRDPADMFLAATAKVFDLTLVTADEHLLAAKEISVLRA